jgi:hypothetical protein
VTYWILAPVVVYGRTRRADRWWRAIPDGVDEQWVVGVVTAVVDGGRHLAGCPRFVLAHNGRERLVGVACRASDLSETMNQDPGGRPLYCFVGWVGGGQKGYPAAPMLARLRERYGEWAGEVYDWVVAPDWEQHPRELHEPRRSKRAPAPWSETDVSNERPAKEPIAAREAWPAEDAERLWEQADWFPLPAVAVGWRTTPDDRSGALTHVAADDVAERQRWEPLPPTRQLDPIPGPRASPPPRTFAPPPAPPPDSAAGEPGWHRPEERSRPRRRRRDPFRSVRSAAKSVSDWLDVPPEPDAHDHPPLDPGSAPAPRATQPPSSGPPRPPPAKLGHWQPKKEHTPPTPTLEEFPGRFVSRPPDAPPSDPAVAQPPSRDSAPAADETPDLDTGGTGEPASPGDEREATAAPAQETDELADRGPDPEMAPDPQPDGPPGPPG